MLRALQHFARLFVHNLRERIQRDGVADCARRQHAEAAGEVRGKRGRAASGRTLRIALSVLAVIVNPNRSELLNQRSHLATFLPSTDGTKHLPNQYLRETLNTKDNRQRAAYVTTLIAACLAKRPSNSEGLSGTLLTAVPTEHSDVFTMLNIKDCTVSRTSPLYSVCIRTMLPTHGPL